jgi:hypothetical protein
MKLEEIAATPDGTYAGARFSAASKDAIAQYIKKHNIPNAPNPDSLHTTILYSRKFLPEFSAKGPYEPTIKAVPTGFESWPSQPDENGHRKNCLVLTFDAPDLVKRHESLMDTHKATYDFDEYKPHVTFSYDAGDRNPDRMPELGSFKRISVAISLTFLYK